MRAFLRWRRAVPAALLSAVVTACDDPIIFVGDLPGLMRRVAGVPGEIGESSDSVARNTELNEPSGLALAADGTLYIADANNARIIAVTPSGRAMVFADDDDCTGDCLVEPYALDVAADGSVWIADVGANRIFRLIPESGVLELRAGTGEAGSSPDGTPVLEAQLDEPSGIAVASASVVYFSERGGHRVRWISSQGTLRTIAGTGVAGYSDGSPATQAQLDGPEGLALHGSLLYLADTQNDRVRVINLVGGGITTLAGIGVAGYEETDTVAATAKLNRPRAVAVTPDGDQLFIADAANDRVRVMNLETGRLTRFAGDGEAGLDPEGMDAADTSLEAPGGLAVHGDGTLFISDTGHALVWRTRLRF